MVARGRHADEADVIRDAVRRLADSDIDPETGVPIAQLREELAAAEASQHSESTVIEIYERIAAQCQPATASN